MEKNLNNFFKIEVFNVSHINCLIKAMFNYQFAINFWIVIEVTF
jgi:hypothetical protein